MKQLLAASLIALTMVTSTPSFTPPVYARTLEEYNTNLVYKKTRQSIVLIQNTFIDSEGVFRTGLGSGFIYDEEKHLVVTVAHVVAHHNDGDLITVTLYDGRKYIGKITLIDEGRDLAMLELQPMPMVGIPENPPPVPEPVDNLPSELPLISYKKLRIGDKVIAIGHPYGLYYSVSVGIVSGFRKEKSGPWFVIHNAVQTDAAINPGNSGGPLLNSDGKVIGLVSFGISAAKGASSGVAMAISTDDIVQFADGH